MKKNDGNGNGHAAVDQGTYLWLVRLLHEIKPGQVDQKSVQSFMFALLQNSTLQSFEPQVRDELIKRINQEGKRLGIAEHETTQKI